METAVKEGGINSFKFFMAYKGALMISDEELIQAMKKAKSLGALTMVHAENGDAVAEGQRHVFDDLHIHEPKGHTLSRPSVLETEATHRAVSLARWLDAPLYVVHVMNKEAVEVIQRAREVSELMGLY
eukprot:GHVN01054231.1.p2 GENE.GHVN01054231.1~~GHVN01054231.1.p2  ORF type:complete len:128 (-),score=16.59 GHVN01054231.1:25-408(-)